MDNHPFIYNLNSSLLNDKLTSICIEKSGITIEFKFAVFNFSPLFVCCCCIDVGISKEKSYFHCLLLRTLSYFTYIYSKLAQLSHVVFIYKLNFFSFCFVKNYSHHCLSASYWTIYLCVNFINRDWITFSNKGIKYILTKLFSFNNHLLWVWVQLWVKSC